MGMPGVIGREVPGAGERGIAFGRLLQAMQDRHQVDVGEGELLTRQVAGSRGADLRRVERFSVST